MAQRELIGMTLHFKDGSKEKVPVSALVNWRQGGGGSGGGGRKKGKYNWIDEPECPQHGRWDVIPAGSNDRNSWNAFYVCSEDDCNNRPGRDWVNDNPAEEYDAEYANDDSAEDEDAPSDDDLPF